MSAPAISICIPTWNRARYLADLLDRLAAEMGDLAEHVEVIVADNASTDATPDICSSFASEGKIRYIRQPRNLGAANNLRNAISQATGKYTMYLADDDIVVWSGLNQALSQLEAHPDAIALYAPWLLVDLANDRIDGQFYSQPTTEVIRRGDYRCLATHVLKHRIFSEISIVRTSVYKRLLPGVNDIAFWAFVIPCELLGFGDIIYAMEPFYGSVTRHPGEDDRSQAGHEEVQIGWDRYRGGVEHMIGLARPALSGAELAAVRAEAEALVTDRMSIALRLRLAQRKDPLDSYHLASRMRGLGAEAKLPAPFDAIRSHAAVAFIARNIPAVFSAERVLLAGDFAENVAALVAQVSDHPVARAVSGKDITERDVLFVSGDGSSLRAAGIDPEAAAFAISEVDLMSKFP